MHKRGQEIEMERKCLISEGVRTELDRDALSGRLTFGAEYGR